MTQFRRFVEPLQHLFCLLDDYGSRTWKVDLYDLDRDARISIAHAFDRLSHRPIRS